MERQRERPRGRKVVGGGLAGPDPARVTFEDLAAILVRDYRVNERKSLERAQASIKWLAVVFGGQKVRTINRARLDACVVARMDGTLKPKSATERKKQEERDYSAKPATVQKELAALRRMFTLAVDGGLVPLSKVPKFPTLEIRGTRGEGFFEQRRAARGARAPSPRAPAGARAVRLLQRLEEVGGPRADLGPGRLRRRCGPPRAGDHEERRGALPPVRRGRRVGRPPPSAARATVGAGA